MQFPNNNYFEFLTVRVYQFFLKKKNKHLNTFRKAATYHIYFLTTQGFSHLFSFSVSSNYSATQEHVYIIIFTIIPRTDHNQCQVCLHSACMQGSKKNPSGRPGQVDFKVGQVTFHIHLPDGQVPSQNPLPTK